MDVHDWNLIKDSFKTSGTKKTPCPICSESRKNKKDPCLYINYNDGIAKCFNCDGLFFREEKTIERREYNIPKQDWQNFTKLSDNLVKWFSKRRIRQETLIKFNITEERIYQPKKGKEVNNVVFNYFEKTTVVNKKFRSADKCFTQSQGGKPIMYNINAVIGAKTVYIVEGEIDVLSMDEAGFSTTVSIPNGANDNDDYWRNSEPYFEGVEEFIIGTDNDEKGIAIREKIAQRLGRYRCKYIEWRNKDANEDLVDNCLHDSVMNAKKFPVAGTFTMEDMYSDILSLYTNGIPETFSPKHACFGNLKDIFSLMRGQVITITGIPSHGKSTFTDWYILNLVKDYDMKASLFSPEHSPMALYGANFMQKAVGKPFFSNNHSERMTMADIQRAKKWFEERIYFTAGEKGDTPSWDWLFDKFKEQMYSYGIDIFLIDAFNKVKFKNGKSKESIDEVLTELTMFAQINNVLIFLVAHPTKMKKNERGAYEEPTLYDVSGTSDFRNQTHAGYCIYRHFPSGGQDGYTTFRNLKTKFSFQGEIGATVSFNYHAPTGRFYVFGSHPPTHDLTKDDSGVQGVYQEFYNIVEPKVVSPFEDEFIGSVPDDMPF